MGFTPEKAAIRFGEGLSPVLASPDSIEAIQAQLRQPDDIAEKFPIARFSKLQAEMTEILKVQRQARRHKGEDRADKLRASRRNRNAFAKRLSHDGRLLFARSIATDAPFRERLVRFWGDHFTVIGKNVLLRFAVPHFLEEAIRPHITGRFSEMLRAVVTHPMMLIYLDQTASFGPNSPAAKGKRGLNENLAREILELHTLGVGASYTQSDVRQFAELLTGLTANLNQGMIFDPSRAEPGAEQVIGTSYGGDTPAIEDIFTVLDDLAARPETARHLARKLATHFCSDIPPPDLVEALTRSYLDSGGDLEVVYAALLKHPAAWDSFGQKVKQPVDFVISAMRALRVPSASLEKLNLRNLESYVGGPLRAMGQPPFSPDGPDGWPEAAEAWVTPHGLAARLQWALAAPSAIFRALPDPRAFLTVALGDLADERLRFAAASAENRREGIALILTSPAFQRR